jgi:TolB protein
MPAVFRRGISGLPGLKCFKTTSGGLDVTPFWSPDGNKIAFRGNRSGKDDIFVVTISPVAVTKLTSLGNNYFQSWSPDGAKILFLSTRDGNPEIYTMNTDGTAQSRLTNTTTAEAYAVWSADARQIAFQRTNDIYLMNADGSNQRQFTNTASRTEFEIVWWQSKQSS